LARIYFLLFLVMASWGFNVAALATLVKEIDPITMTAFRILTAGIMVLVISKIMGIFGKRKIPIIFEITNTIISAVNIRNAVIVIGSISFTSVAKAATLNHHDAITMNNKK